MWIAAIGHNERPTPLRVQLTLAFDRKPDGPGALFNQPDNRFAAPHADGVAQLSAWVLPDAHRISQFAMLRHGVTLARKGWLRREDVMNTMPFEEVRKALAIKRGKKI